MKRIHMVAVAVLIAGGGLALDVARELATYIVEKGKPLVALDK